MKTMFIAACMLLCHTALAQPTAATDLPTPSANQLRWHDMEMYAFLHYSLNTYTDQEWGYGNESPQLFNPSQLDCRQWARVCRQAGMSGIILTAKHHGGFCLWPSAYTDYSVRSAPWRGGRGDVVGELAEACRQEGLAFGVYVSPWDRHHPAYGRPEYITYFRNQLRELLTRYGDIFEVWFDGANGGNGWYGGADERRTIDATTYYAWPETYAMVRSLQPRCLIWNDGGDRGDLRWVGAEDGSAGTTNWCLLNATGPVPRQQLRCGLAGGNAWVPAEADTSIRPGWFYHAREDTLVKPLARLMDIYYKSVGRNAALLLNIPIAPNGRIHPADSLRATAFHDCIRRTFATNLADSAQLTREADTWTYTFRHPTPINRFLAGEDIRLGQRVSRFALHARVGDQWLPLTDALADTPATPDDTTPDGALTTIGHKRIVCFPTIAATALRFTILEATATPAMARIGLYLAPQP